MRREMQLVHMRGEPDVDRQHPELAQHLQNALLGGDRQREDDEIDACRRENSRRSSTVPSLRNSPIVGRRAIVRPIIENAENFKSDCG